MGSRPSERHLKILSSPPSWKLEKQDLKLNYIDIYKKRFLKVGVREKMCERERKKKKGVRGKSGRGKEMSDRERELREKSCAIYLDLLKGWCFQAGTERAVLCPCQLMSAGQRER